MPEAFTAIDLKELREFKLTNSNGVEVSITNFGGKIMSLIVPDRNGTMADIVLGYDEPAAYVSGNPYFGALIGRYGNRIAKGRFSINGTAYQLSINSRSDALHGGPNGFHNKLWEVKQPNHKGSNKLTLSLISPDGEEGYPGELQVNVTYTLNDQNELEIEYYAITSSDTIVNLTNHAFFNLAGEGNGDILEHQLQINASHYIPVREGLIPTGKKLSVEGTSFDFRKLMAIGKRIFENDEQLKLGRGYDHNWVLDKSEDSISLAAYVQEPKSGRTMEVWTTEPGLQFYSGNFLDGSDIGKRGKPYPFRSALCLEAQHFPDSPNHLNFPSTLLKPGEKYEQKTTYKFGVDTKPRIL